MFTFVLLIKLKVEEPKIVFDPAFKEIRDIILRCFSEIVASGDGLTRVRILDIEIMEKGDN
jgi:dynein heavy chain